MQTTLISIIVPIYNVEKYLDKCINSIVNQTYSNLEIILVNDGSPDSCPEMCDAWCHRDVRIKVIHKKNGGLSDARNTGIDIATGDYIMFIDSDDYINEKMVEILYSRIKKDQSDLALCNFLYIAPNYAEIVNLNVNSPINDEILTKDEAFTKLTGPKSWYYVIACNKMYSKSIFDELRYPKGKIHEDEFLIHQIFDRCKKISCCSQSLYYYVQHENSITRSTYSVKRLDCVEALLNRAIFFFKHRMQELASSSFLFAYYKLINGYTCLDVSEANNLFRLKELRKYFKQAYFSYFLLHLNFSQQFYIAAFLLHPQLPIKVLLKIRASIKRLIRFALLRRFRAHLKWTKSIKKQIEAGKSKQNIFLIATPCHGNLGDHAIVFAEKLLAEKSNLNLIEISNNEYKNKKKILQSFIAENDIVAIDGGGNLGTLWPWEDDKISEIIDTYKNNRIIIFPQTAYYSHTQEGDERLASNQQIYARAKNLTLCLRDKASYVFCSKHFKTTNCIYTPDIVLYINQNKNIIKRSNCLLCLRSDLESVLKYDDRRRLEKKLKQEGLEFSYTDTVIQSNVSMQTRNQELEQKWAEFASSKLIVTDRLHGMIFAAITGTPCLALDNLSKKVSGVYQWINNLSYIRVCHSLDELIEHIDVFANMGQQRYDAPHIQDIFNKLLININHD